MVFGQLRSVELVECELEVNVFDHGLSMPKTASSESDEDTYLVLDAPRLHLDWTSVTFVAVFEEAVTVSTDPFM